MSTFIKSGLVCKYLLYGPLHFSECLKYITIQRKEKSPAALKTVTGQKSVSVSSTPLHSGRRRL